MVVYLISGMEYTRIDMQGFARACFKNSFLKYKKINISNFFSSSR